MEIIKSPRELQSMVIDIKKQHKEIGFVPTMGAFHEGHTSLMKQARKENDLLITSIFVNPLQFGANEDFDTYPRNADHDIEIAKKHGVDILFMPEVEDMYPQELSIRMHVTKRTNVLCGKSRPGHFDGVVTVLTKLFNIIMPNRAYFGLKDAQQFAVVDSLITDYNFPIELIGLPTIRDNNGLANSSRNVNLDQAEYEEALWLYRALKHGQQMIKAGEKNPQLIISEVNNIIAANTSGTIDYIEVLSYPELTPIKQIDSLIILAVAVKFSRARLIDNMLLDKDGNIVPSLR